MEDKPPTRKMKFAPRGPPKRVPKQEIKPEPVENESSSAEAMELLRRVNERSLRKPKMEKKVPASQVAWMGGVVNSSGSERYHYGSNIYGAGSCGTNATHEIEYQEPWDHNSYRPNVLPLRRPYSGNPEILDEEEFNRPAQNHANARNSAADLGLTEDNGDQKILFMRLPSIPMVKAESRETKPNNRGGGEKTIDLKADLPEGFMGKLLVYKSGAVKIKIGDVLYNVSRGLKNEFAQDVMVVNEDDKTCCLVGDVSKHAILTPDIDSLLKDF